MKLIVECGATKSQWTLLPAAPAAAPLGAAQPQGAVPQSAPLGVAQPQGAVPQSASLSAALPLRAPSGAQEAAGPRIFFTGGMNFSSGEEDYLFSTLQDGLRWVDSALAAQHDVAATEPQPTSAQPDPTSAASALDSAQHDAAATEPQTTSAQPDPTSAASAFDSAQHDAAATEPQPTSAQPVRDADVSEVNFYAAGLFPGTERYERLEALLSAAFPGADVCLESDLLAAARAVCGHSAGVAVILGTGSNACLYDGSRIVETVPSGGFILGDEGSASALGRSFVSDYIKGLVPKAMAAHFASRFDMAYPALVHEVYHGASPAGFLGKFAPEILGFYAIDPYAKALVDDNFRSFIRRCLIPLLSAATAVPPGSNACPDSSTALASAPASSQAPVGTPAPDPASAPATPHACPISAASQNTAAASVASAVTPQTLPVGVVGGFGCAYREILSSVGAEEGVAFARFLASPSDELIAYHQ